VGALAQRGFSETPLPIELAIGLSPQLLGAMNQLNRRQLLRVLNSDGGRSWSRPELEATERVTCSPASLHYHASVLVGCNVAERFHPGSDPTRPTSEIARFRSTVALNPEVSHVLTLIAHHDSTIARELTARKAEAASN
jgi:hypothetical protein